MPFKHACFVSYAHPNPGNLVLPKFILELKRCLQSEVDLQISTDCRVYVDEERLRPGYLFPEALAQAMCESACWIMVFAPSYADRGYCRREYLAMLDLQTKRRASLGDRLAPEIGMIIPILLRGTIAELPPEIRESVHVETRLGRYLMGGGKLHRNPAFVDCVMEIMDTIRETWRATRCSETIALECRDYRLPADGGSWSDERGGARSLPTRQ